MSKCMSESHNALRNILCSNWKLHAPNVWAHPHCQPFLQSVSAHFSQSRHLFLPLCCILCIISKTSKQMTRSFNWPQIFFWPNVKDAVILIRATRDRIFSLLKTMFSCRNITFPQLIGCRRRLLQKLARKIA